MKRTLDSVIRLSDLKRFVPADAQRRGEFFARIMDELSLILTELASVGWTGERKAWIREQARKNQRRPARRVAFRILAGHVYCMSVDSLTSKCLRNDFEYFQLVSHALTGQETPAELRAAITATFTWPTRDSAEAWRYITLYMSLVALHFASNTELVVDTDRLRRSQVLRDIQSVQWKLEKNNIADAIDILDLVKRSLHLFPPVI